MDHVRWGIIVPTELHTHYRVIPEPLTTEPDKVSVINAARDSTVQKIQQLVSTNVQWGIIVRKEHPNLTPIHVLSERTAIKQDEQAKVIVLRVILECIAQTLDELNRTISAMVVGIVVEVHGQTHR